MAKAKGKNAAATDGKVVEIVTRTTERRSGEDSELDINGAGAADDEGGEGDGLDALDDLGDSGARLEIRRTSPAEFAGYIGTYSRDGWTPDRLFEEWGGGKFTIRVRLQNGTLHGMRHTQLAGKPKNKAEPAAAVAPVAQGVDSGMAQVLAAIQASNAAAAAAAQNSTKEQMGMLTSLLTALITKEAPKPAIGPDPLAILEKAATILRPRGESGDTMSAFIKGLDMGRDMGGGGNGEPGMASMFMEGIKTLKQTALLQGQRRPQRRAPPPGTVAAEGPALAPPTNKVEPASDTDKQIAWIKQQAAFLVLQASRKKTPSLYAELFVDNLPSFLPAEQVLEQMQQPGAIEQLGYIHADVLKFPEWFEEFRAKVVEFIAGPLDAAGSAGSAPADPAPPGNVFEHDGANDDGGGG